MQQPTRGFTLIEQVVAIALVGTVSATALPAFTALRAQVDATALSSLAASASSAMLLNQAACMLSQQQAVPGKCLPVRHCADVAALLIGGVPPGYQVLPKPLQGQDQHCQLQQVQGGQTAAFYAMATGG